MSEVKKASERMAEIMYKDVKKKLLAVALSICMVIGVVEIVPRVRAASNTGEVIVTAHDAANSSITETFTIKLEQRTFSYSGGVQKPKIDSITGNSGQTYAKTLFAITAPESVSIGTYTCVVNEGSSDWVFEGDVDARSMTYQIEAIAVNRLVVASKDALKDIIVDYTGSVVYPDKSKVTVVANSTELNDTQFEFTGGASSVGKVTAKVNVTDQNYSQGSLKSNDVEYVIAYNLANKNVNTGCVASLQNPTLGYNGGSAIADPIVDIKNGTSTVLSISRTGINANSNFKIRYIKLEKEPNGTISNRTPVDGSLTQAGEYEIEVTPKDGADTCVAIDGNYFTGTFTQEFSVERINAENSWVVSATDAYGISHDLNGPNQNGYILKLPFNGGATVPSDVVVKDGNGKLLTPADDYYTITYRNETMPGAARMIIEPKSSTDYKGQVTIVYHITSRLYMQKTVITGASGGPIVVEGGKEPEIVYDGSQHTFDPQNCEVYAEGRTEKLALGTNYTLKVQYNAGNDNYVDITDANREKLAEVGEKRIVITGVGIYEGQIGYQKFWIKPVDLTIPDNRNKCRLELNPSVYYYTGSGIRPNFSFYYNGMLVGTRDNPQGNFNVSVTNNVNAGKDARLVLNMTGTNFIGVYETTFEIRPLPYNNMAIDSTYTYNGEAQIPVYKINVPNNGGDYTLVAGRDYEVVGYRTGSTGPFAATPPVDAGTYEAQIRITTSNIDCGANYTDTHNFTIQPCNIADLPIDIDQAQTVPGNDNKEVEWNGGETKPGLIGIPSYMRPADYTVTYENNKEVSNATGAAIVHVTASANSVNFTGQKDIKFTIISRDMNDSSVEFSVTNTNAATGNKPPYTLRLDVTDKNRAPNDQNLKLGEHYTINEVMLYNFLEDKWEPLGSSDYQPGTGANTITNLAKAGKYRITIEGKGAYKGTKTAADVTCGTDISGYKARIKKTGEVTFKYNGTDQTPTDFLLYNANTQRDVEGITYPNDFTVAYYREDTFVDMNKDAGKIYVLAVGKPESGYFGKTEAWDSTTARSYYTISPATWTTENFEIEVVDVDDVIYLPGQGTPVPSVVLRFKTGAVSGGAAVWETLEEGRDYDAVYNSVGEDADGNEVLGNDFYSAGSKRITITGKGNFLNNNRRQNYRVKPRDINDKK